MCGWGAFGPPNLFPVQRVTEGAATVNPDRQRDEAGFTLVELLIVVGIIGVLIGVMVPTLLQARTPAQDRQAQNLLRNSLTAAKSIGTSDGVEPTQATLATEEIGVSFMDGTTTAPAGTRNVSVANGVVGTTWYLVLASQSTSGRCFAVLERPGQSPQFQRVESSPTCRAAQFDSTTGWSSAWP